MAKWAFLFPGQGSQYVGMGKDLKQNFKVAADIFAEADEALHEDLSKLCFEGPEDELRQTVNAQPALVTASFACLEAAREVGNLPTPSFLAGHSLGEYTALHLAGVFGFEDGLKLVVARGRYMQEATVASPGGMVAVMGADGQAVGQEWSKGKPLHRPGLS